MIGLDRQLTKRCSWKVAALDSVASGLKRTRSTPPWSKLARPYPRGYIRNSVVLPRFQSFSQTHRIWDRVALMGFFFGCLIECLDRIPKKVNLLNMY